MYATVGIHIAGAPGLGLPRNALVHLGEQTVVFVKVPGLSPDGRARFERRPVKVDEDVSGDFLPVIRGLSEGEAVVVDGALLLSQLS
jgi:hypothetical protein